MVLNIGITCCNKNLKKTIFNNGILQNSITLYRLLIKLKYKPFWILNGNDKFEKYFNDEKSLLINDINNTNCDLIILFGTEINKIFDIPTIYYHCGNRYYTDLNNLKYDLYKYNDVKYIRIDNIFYVPQHINLKEYFMTYGKCEKSNCVPHIYEPFFKKIEDTSYINKKLDIYICEPNLHIIKNSIIPMCIINKFLENKKNYDNIGDIIFFCNKDPCEYFKNNIIKRLSMINDNVDNKKIKFMGRFPINEILNNNRCIVLSHQTNNELNYLYYDCIYNNTLLVHNSKMFGIDRGYYYKDNCIDSAVRCLENAVKDHSIIYDKDILTEYSIDNKRNQYIYKAHIEDTIQNYWNSKLQSNLLKDKMIKLNNIIYIFTDNGNIISENKTEGYYLYDGDKYFLAIDNNYYYIYRLKKNLDIYYINTNEWINGSIEN